ncbi:CorA family magnesium ion transporter [Reticulomyxa filosa]|uniref:CorA family magnesium ion transporter n=1 Tax=Reticulomyxa filosa TaxID=46433 RepID=X6M725_RETFI|nr:CorA family magnesium ion transporter [Reticulomyxa filosa]|eukprot:ETO08820.1 CorA family magnesium ion transporter [Reticulomyxa filosa]
MQINITLETKNQGDILSLLTSENLIGFINISHEQAKQKQYDISLEFLREQINGQFDDDQLRVTGNNFLFLNEGIPVSRRQESFLTSNDISLPVVLPTYNAKSIGQDECHTLCKLKTAKSLTPTTKNKPDSDGNDIEHGNIIPNELTMTDNQQRVKKLNVTDNDSEKVCSNDILACSFEDNENNEPCINETSKECKNENGCQNSMVEKDITINERSNILKDEYDQQQQHGVVEVEEASQVVNLHWVHPYTTVSEPQYENQPHHFQYLFMNEGVLNNSVAPFSVSTLDTINSAPSVVSNASQTPIYIRMPTLIRTKQCSCDKVTVFKDTEPYEVKDITCKNKKPEKQEVKFDISCATCKLQRPLIRQVVMIRVSNALSNMQQNTDESSLFLAKPLLLHSTTLMTNQQDSDHTLTEKCPIGTNANSSALGQQSPEKKLLLSTNDVSMAPEIVTAPMKKAAKEKKKKDRLTQIPRLLSSKGYDGSSSSDIEKSSDESSAKEENYTQMQGPKDAINTRLEKKIHESLPTINANNQMWSLKPPLAEKNNDHTYFRTTSSSIVNENQFDDFEAQPSHPAIPVATVSGEKMPKTKFSALTPLNLDQDMQPDNLSKELQKGDTLKLQVISGMQKIDTNIDINKPMDITTPNQTVTTQKEDSHPSTETRRQSMWQKTIDNLKNSFFDNAADTNKSLQTFKNETYSFSNMCLQKKKWFIIVNGHASEGRKSGTVENASLTSFERRPLNLNMDGLIMQEDGGKGIFNKKKLCENKFIIVGPSTHGPSTQSSCNKHIEVNQPEDLLKRLSQLKHTHKHPVWVDMSCDYETFELVAEHIRPSIHPLTIEDCVSRDCREKLEIFDHYLFMSIRAPTIDREKTQRISIIVFKTIILTYHEQPAAVMDDTRKIIKRRHFPGLTPKWLCPSPGWVCHAIVDGVIDSLIPDVNRVVAELDNLEKMVFMVNVDSQNELLHRIQNGRIWLSLYRHRLWAKSTLVHNLNNLQWRTFLQDVPAPYWRDINDHLSRMVDSIQIGLQTLDSLQSIFVAKISLDMSRHSNDLNEIAGKLGSFGAFFLPLTFFTGLWGMNTWVPFKADTPDLLPAGYTWAGFFIVLGIMFVVSFFMYSRYFNLNFVKCSHFKIATLFSRIKIAYMYAQFQL